MRVVVIGEKNSIGKLRPQCSQNHEFIVNVLAEQTNGANARAFLSLQARVVLFHLPRQSSQVIRLVQSFCGFDRDRILPELRFLRLVALTLFGLIAWQLPINSAQITVRVHPFRPVVRLLNDLINASTGSLGCENRA